MSEISSETRAALEVIIREIQDDLPKGIDEIVKTLNSWIKANNLHPENVNILYAVKREMKKK